MLDIAVFNLRFTINYDAARAAHKLFLTNYY